MADYAFEGPKWDSNIVTWSFATATYDAAYPYSRPVDEAPFQDVIRQAFAAWAPYAGLTFAEVSDSASVDIRVGFGNFASSGTIGDEFYRSSQGVFLPGVGIRLEDPAETPLEDIGGTYTYSGYTTTLLQVAEHEIGHSLGLAHSTDLNAVMYPTVGLSNPTVGSSDILGIETLYANSSIAVLDTATGQDLAAAAIPPNDGPAQGLQNEYISVTSDSLNISTASPGWFIRSGSGDDAIAVSSGTNVLDGGTGSNLLIGGSGTDTLLVDDRAATADIWSTIVGFNAGDAATIWGLTAQDSGIVWADGQGADGFTGLTLQATASAKPTASLTLVGYSQADLGNGRLTVHFGTDEGSGSAYMYVHGNS